MKEKQIDLQSVRWFGRTLKENGLVYFNYSCSGFEFCFKGTKANADFISDVASFNEKTQSVLGLYIKEINSINDFYGKSFWEVSDEDFKSKIVLSEKENNVCLFKSDVEKIVIIKVIKFSEVAFASTGLKSINILGKQIKPKKNRKQRNNFLLNSKPKRNLKIEFIGDSLTCGYGIEGNLNVQFDTKDERPDKSYAYLTAKKLNAEFQKVCWSGIGLISNYVDKEKTQEPSTSNSMALLWPYTDKSMNIRLGTECEIWDEKNFSPDCVIVNIGTNDCSFINCIEDEKIKNNKRKLFSLAYRLFIEEIHRRSPKAKIICCFGIVTDEVSKEISNTVDLVSKEFPKAFIKFVELSKVDSEKEGWGTDYHPTAQTHEKVAENFYNQIKDFFN